MEAPLPADWLPPGIASPRKADRRSRMQFAALAACVGLAVFWNGGFEPGPRLAFAILAGAALLLTDRRSAGPFVTDPIVIGLLALAALSALSSLWTVASGEDALRWGLVITAYAAVVVIAGSVTVRLGLLGPVALIAVVALAAGALGVVAATLGSAPMAERIGGSWRAGGPFQYPPALALAEIAALPAFCAAMCSRKTALVAAGALGWSLAAAVIALADSRTSLAIALLALLTLLASPMPGLTRSRQLAATALFAAVAAAVQITVGGVVDGPDRGAPELLSVIAIAAAAVAIWLWIARRLPSAAGAAGARAALPARAGALLAVAGIAVIALAVTAPEGGGIEPVKGFAHGREKQWEAALDVFGRRPLAGSGAESYLTASLGDQGRHPVRYAHSMPLETAAELGLLGLIALATVGAGVALALWRTRGTPGFWLLAPGAAALPLSGLVDWSWHLAGVGALWAVAAGALIAIAQSPRPRADPRGALLTSAAVNKEGRS